jgi:predicted ATP-dependent endonuclease of OLD family
MLLKKIELINFLSIKGTLAIDFDRKVTIFLGSNDHGKSNILSALQHLNNDVPIEQDEVNWDARGDASISFSLSLSARETETWKEYVEVLLQGMRERAAKAQGKSEAPDEETRVPEDTLKTEPTPSAPAAPAAETAPTTPPAPAEKAVTKKPATPEKKRLMAEELPPTVLNPNLTSMTLKRAGAGGPLQFEEIDISALPDEMEVFINEYKPRVELFKVMSGSLQDSATATDIATDAFEFLQGVFFYAGLDPRDCSKLFTRTDKTMRDLQNASKTLDDNLRQLWGQGTDLHFHLSHKGTEKASAIEFLADDPSIETQVARMSKRSSGVTQFFTVSMILNARRSKFPANSYIYLFDEPGVYLHPQGQRDLLQVFEKLADENQIVYATHSLFLLNQNFPERHRLVFKDKDGTKIDQKPYQQNWKRATDALGIYLTSNILFSDRVLLTEGDSDPIYIYELFRQLNKIKDVDVDLNLLGIMSFYNYQNLRFLLQVFKREVTDTNVIVLVDGDVGGKGLAQQIAELCGKLKVQTIKLADGRSIEDYCLFEEQFVAAVAMTIRNACEVEEKPIPAGLDDLVKKSWETHKAGKGKPEKREKGEKGDEGKEPKREKVTTGRWFKDITRELMDDEASKVVLARNYVELCRQIIDIQPKKERIKDAVSLCRSIATELKIPGVRAERLVEPVDSKKT